MNWQTLMMGKFLFLIEKKRKLSRIERQIQTCSLSSRTSAMRPFLPDNSLFLIQYSKLLCDYHFKHFSRRIIFLNWEKRKMRSSGSKSIKVTDDHVNCTLVFVPYEFQNEFLKSWIWILWFRHFDHGRDSQTRDHPLDGSEPDQENSSAKLEFFTKNSNGKGRCYQAITR